MVIFMTAAETADAGQTASSGTDWGTVIVAVVGFVGIIVTQLLTRQRDKAQQDHQTASALRQRRVDVYTELIEAANNLMLKIPEVLTGESDGGSLTAEERSPLNAASSKAHLMASRPVQEKVTELVDAVYAFADNMSGQAWDAFDHAMDAFVDAAQAERDHGNILGLREQRPKKGQKQNGG
jgi:hypothetical protein